jgi:hypothetical protein
LILNCTFEELRALESGAELLLGTPSGVTSGAVAAPVEALVEVALLQPRLKHSLTIESLQEQRSVRSAVAAICHGLHDRLDEKVLEYHPAHEEAVALYFDYAHAYGVLRRLDEMGAEMTAMIELMTGARPTEETARGVTFPD